jgi:unsaturated chondroitin disaccharide hydrolase
MGAAYPDVKIIIDTMLNLPLLYWATSQTGDLKYARVALDHAITASQYLIRDDASSFHTYLMDPNTGKAVEGKTHQGRFDESTWARGQSWAVYGFALSYAYTREPYFLDVARKTAHYFINNLPEDFVPYWDFSFNDREPDIRDTSAGAIFVCGLLEMAKHLDDAEREFYLKVAYKTMESLINNYSTENTPESNGLLLHGMYHHDHGADECTIWGDYFYFEALVRLLTPWKMFW